MREKPRALIVVDVQNDFCPGGSLAVAHGDEVITPLNKLRTTEGGAHFLPISFRGSTLILVWVPHNSG